MKKYKFYYCFFSLIFIVSGIALFTKPQSGFTENENRYLTQWPSVTIGKILSGEVQKDLTNGANDQFPFRNFWMETATSLQRLAGAEDVGGVYFGKNHRYFEKILDSDFSAEHYDNNLRYIDKLASSVSVPVSVMLVPSPGTVLKEDLPEHAVLYHAETYEKQGSKLLKYAKWLDVRTPMEQAENKENLYYKTDHHWTLMGAYEGYKTYASAAGFHAEDYESFEPVCGSDKFYGTLYSKALDQNAQPDTLLYQKKLPEVTVKIDDTETDSIYDLSKLDMKDKYGVYFGGNYGMVTITNQNQDRAKNGKKLLLIKDSFANSMVPYLISQYDEIIMLDFRYYNEPVATLLEKEQPTEILVLYEMSNFMQDANLYKLILGL